MALDPRIRTVMLVTLFAAGLAGCAGPLRERHEGTMHHHACRGHGPGHHGEMMQGGMMQGGMMRDDMRAERRHHRRDCRIDRASRRS